MAIEIRVESSDPRRPNPELWSQIEASQSELNSFLRKENPQIENATVEPLSGYPSGLEAFVIVVVIEFAKGVAEGAAHAGGKALGEQIVKWLKSKFKDIRVSEIEKK